MDRMASISLQGSIRFSLIVGLGCLQTTLVEIIGLRKPMQRSIESVQLLVSQTKSLSARVPPLKEQPT